LRRWYTQVLWRLDIPWPVRTLECSAEVQQGHSLIRIVSQSFIDAYCSAPSLSRRDTLHHDIEEWEEEKDKTSTIYPGAGRSCLERTLSFIFRFVIIRYHTMSGSGRHSSHDGNSEGRTPNSYGYTDQYMSGQQYLRPEDVYRLEREGTYFNTTSSYAQSRHSSDAGSPGYQQNTSQHQQSRHQSNPQSPYVEYPYTQLSRRASGEDSGLGSSRRVTPPERSTAASRHSSAGSHRSSPPERVYSEDRSTQGASQRTEKGKERESQRNSTSSRGGAGSGGGRHSSESAGGGRKPAMGPHQKRLVNGVFIRY
jgi:hypothetical protein